MIEHSPFRFDNSYKASLEGFYLPWKGAVAADPSILRVNAELADELGLDPHQLTTARAAAWLTGSDMPKGAASIAMAYAGHQFGGFSPQLGDGRALLLGEVFDTSGNRRDIHLKGSGRTPFSRGGDGKAVLGPVLREYLIGEAMHALGIPTTRALAVALTGEDVERDGYEKGAVLTRIAASHLRFGTFQYFAARGETDRVQQLVDYAIARHYPEIAHHEDRALELFRRVRDAQAELVAMWVSIGFVHGVMNTDNMTISGETIDYGPCAFIDAYDPQAVFSSIDQAGRYAYGNQPTITQWNLSRFAETLIEMVDPEDQENAIRQLTNEINEFPARYQTVWLRLMRAKLGLVNAEGADIDLANNLHEVMVGQNVDFTKLFRALADVVRGDKARVRSLFRSPDAKLEDWLTAYQSRLVREGRKASAVAADMDSVNPLYIPRNHLVEQALDAAKRDELGPFDRLLNILKSPFQVHDGAEQFAEGAPDGFGPYKTYSGT